MSSHGHMHAHSGHDHAFLHMAADEAVSALVVVAGHPDDAFFRAAVARMKQRFAIGHVTLQASTEPLMVACGGPKAPSGPHGDRALSGASHH